MAKGWVEPEKPDVTALPVTLPENLQPAVSTPIDWAQIAKDAADAMKKVREEMANVSAAFAAAVWDGTFTPPTVKQMTILDEVDLSKMSISNGKISGVDWAKPTPIEWGPEDEARQS
jgi:hypothetical protein